MDVNTVKNVGKVVVAIGGAIVASELGCLGTSMAIEDGITIKDTAKELVNPTPYKVKNKGLFKKPFVVKVNPITNKMSAYTGSKEPVNKKPIKLS